MRKALKDFVAAVGLVLACALLSLTLPVQAQAPQAAQQYRALLVRTAHAAWGLDAPVAVFAAQVHQESAWRADAVSRVGAQGLAPGHHLRDALLHPAILADGHVGGRVPHADSLSGPEPP